MKKHFQLYGYCHVKYVKALNKVVLCCENASKVRAFAPPLGKIDTNFPRLHSNSFRLLKWYLDTCSLFHQIYFRFLSNIKKLDRVREAIFKKKKIKG